MIFNVRQVDFWWRREKAALNISALAWPVAKIREMPKIVS
jgi:hypothetical protein